MFASNALHKLIQTQSWDSVESRVISHPGEVRKLSEVDALRDPLKKSKALPLHHAAAQNPPKEVVELLMGSYDKAIRTTETAYHRNALHIACMNRASHSVIEALYRAYPANLKMQDALQRTCLHYLVANGSKISTLKLLLNEFPEAAAVVDHRNWLPLHIAAGMRAPLIVIQLLLEKNPTAVLVLDEDGHSPLALAKRDVIPKRAVDDNVVLFLENAMKEQLKKRGGTDMEEIMIAPVPNIIRVAGDTATDAVSASGVSKASTLSTKVASGSTSSSSSSLKKGLFRRRR